MAKTGRHLFGKRGHARSGSAVASPCLVAAVPPFSMPDGGWFHFALCAVVFGFVGLVSGYFIWRKAAVLAEDAGMEVRRSAAELAKIQSELEREEQVLADTSKPSAPR